MMPGEDRWTISRSVSTINGAPKQAVRIIVGGRIIEAVELDMADQWDFMEMAGAQINNDAWVNTALLASSVISVDGIPQPAGVKTRDGIRQILRKIGAEGVDALQAAFSDGATELAPAGETDNTAAVGN